MASGQGELTTGTGRERELQRPSRGATIVRRNFTSLRFTRGQQVVVFGLVASHCYDQIVQNEQLLIRTMRALVPLIRLVL